MPPRKANQSASSRGGAASLKGKEPGTRYTMEIILHDRETLVKLSDEHKRLHYSIHT